MSLIWYMMMMMMTMMLYVCEKEVCLLCAGGECERYRESVVRTRVPRANFECFSSRKLRVSRSASSFLVSSSRLPWITSLWLVFCAAVSFLCFWKNLTQMPVIFASGL